MSTIMSIIRLILDLGTDITMDMRIAVLRGDIEEVYNLLADDIISYSKVLNKKTQEELVTFLDTKQKDGLQRIVHLYKLSSYGYYRGGFHLLNDCTNDWITEYIDKNMDKFAGQFEEGEFSRFTQVGLKISNNQMLINLARMIGAKIGDHDDTIRS